MLTTTATRLRESGYDTQLIAVTVLTSMTETDLQEVGVGQSTAQQVLGLARLTQDCGLHGVVCAAQEAPLLRAMLGAGFVLVTPGIRPADAAQDDQHRIVTPVDAMRNGATHLVIGRPITRADSPLQQLQGIRQQLADAGF